MPPISLREPVALNKKQAKQMLNRDSDKRPLTSGTRFDTPLRTMLPTQYVCMYVTKICEYAYNNNHQTLLRTNLSTRN